MDPVAEDQCAVCKDWPAAERADRRRQHLESDDYVRMPLNGTCGFCLSAFWDLISVTLKDQEELDAWVEACRQERRKPMASRRHGHELLAEIRSKAPKH
jgi:hypothetical protein